MKKLEIGVIGLGKFGLTFGTKLMEMGHRVVGIDSDEVKVRAAQDQLSRVFQADATDKNVLLQLHYQDMDCVAVSVGHSMETSILAVLNLHDIKVPCIIAKAMSAQHQKVLRRVGAHQVVQPEADVAIQSARRLAYPGMLDFLDVDGGVLLQQVEVNAWDGKSLADLNLTVQHKVMVVARKGTADAKFSFVPDARVPLVKGETLVLIGEPEAVLGLTP